MKALFLLISLLCCSFTALSMTIDMFLFDHRRNLLIFLDWSHKFSEVYEELRLKYMEGTLELRGSFTVKSVDSISATLLRFMSSATQLKNLLVKGQIGNINDDFLVVNAMLVTLFTRSMPLVLDDLTKSIAEWENERQTLRKPLTVMDEKPLKWFKEHGFDESTLKDITIKKLKEEVHRFYSKGRAFDRLLSFLGYSYTVTSSSDVGSKLAWLFTFGNKPRALHCLEKYLRREDSKVLPEITDKIIGSLCKLGHEEEALNRLFGNGRDGGLYPCIMPILNRAFFFQEKGEQYMKVLVDMCSTIEEGLRVLIDALKDVSRANPVMFYRQFGFLYSGTDEHGSQKLLTEIDALTGDNGTITELVQLVNNANGNTELRKPHLYTIMSFDDVLVLRGLLAMGIEHKPILPLPSSADTSIQI